MKHHYPHCEGGDKCECAAIDLADTTNKVLRIIKEHEGLTATTVEQTSTLEALGFDSLDVVELIISCEDEFDIGLETDTVEITSTVDDLITCIKLQRK